MALSRRSSPSKSQLAGLQALLQYASQLNAIQARNTLQGRNIYNGCCTLDIQFSNLQELQVNYNNERTRDFTNATLPSEQTRLGNPGNKIMMFMAWMSFASLREFPYYNYPYSGRGAISIICSMVAIGLLEDFSSLEAPVRHEYFQGSLGGVSAAATVFGGVLPPGITGTNDKSTLVVSNLVPEKIDADKLFNIFSNYGNILRIKILHKKPDHALVQMGDGFQAELAFNYLKGVTLFNKTYGCEFLQACTHQCFSRHGGFLNLSSQPLQPQRGCKEVPVLLCANQDDSCV